MCIFHRPSGFLTLGLVVASSSHLAEPSASFAAPPSPAITGTPWGVSTCYLGATEGNVGFAVADLQGAGLSTYRIYGGMSRWEQADDDGAGHHQAEGANGNAHQHRKPILLHHGKPDDAYGEGREPIAERDGESENDGEHQKRHADQAFAGPGEERGEPRAQELLGALEVRKRTQHDGLEIPARHRLAGEPVGKPWLVAPVGELRREQHERRAEDCREQRYVDRY